MRSTPWNRPQPSRRMGTTRGRSSWWSRTTRRRRSCSPVSWSPPATGPWWLARGPRPWIARNLVPQSQQEAGNGGPRLRAVWMAALIAITALVGNPAERPAIRHADRHWPAGLWHARVEQRRVRQYATNGRERSELRLTAQMARVKAQSAGANLQTSLLIHRYASVALRPLYRGSAPWCAAPFRRPLDRPVSAVALNYASFSFAASVHWSPRAGHHSTRRCGSRCLAGRSCPPI